MDGNYGGDEEVERMLAKLKLSQETYLVTQEENQGTYPYPPREYAGEGSSTYLVTQEENQGTYPYPPREYAGEGSSGSLTARYDDTFVYANPPSYSSYDYLLDSTERFNFPEEQQHTYGQVENRNYGYQGTYPYPPPEYAGEVSAGSFAYTNPPSNSYLLDSTERFNFPEEQQHTYGQVEYTSNENQGTHTYHAAREGLAGSSGYGDVFAYSHNSSGFFPSDSMERLNYAEEEEDEEEQQHTHQQEIFNNVIDLSLYQDFLFRDENASTPAYRLCYSYGTTIIWLKHSDRDLLVAVDSQSTDTIEVPANHKERQFLEIMGSRTLEKFIQITSDDGEMIYAAGAGGAERCDKLIEFVEKEMSIQRGPYSFALICEHAATYIRRNPLSVENKDSKCVVFLCGWNKAEMRYEVMKVGDGFRTPQIMNDFVFGIGNRAYNEGKTKLERLGASAQLKDLRHVMLEISGRDPYTGGPINVYSLVDGTCNKVYSKSLLYKLYKYNKKYVEMFYENSMMVFALKIDELNLTRLDLWKHIKSDIYNKMSRNDIIWLRDSESYIVYLVRFPFPIYGAKWLAMGTKLPNSLFMRYHLTNLDNVHCKYFYGHASATLLECARILT